MTQDGDDPHAIVSACLHRWEPAGDGRVRCIGRCRVVLSGSLADDPPVRGMDWERAAMLPTALRWERRPLKAMALVT